MFGVVMLVGCGLVWECDGLYYQCVIISLFFLSIGSSHVIYSIQLHSGLQGINKVSSCVYEAVYLLFFSISNCFYLLVGLLKTGIAGAFLLVKFSHADFSKFFRAS